jgi:HAD superfamily hydrolase (TIGR01509 family)
LPLPERTRLRAVLFDMDGTLVDTEGLWWQAVEDVASGLGHRLGAADTPEVLGQAVEHTAAHLHRVSRGRRPETDIAAALHTRFAALVATDVRPLPGVLRLLDALAAAAVPIALVSASPRTVVDLVLAVLGRERFAVTVAAGETPRTKPAPDPYRLAADSLGVPPSQCVAVEDTPTGVASAEAAGCAVLAVPSLTTIAPGPGRTVRQTLHDVDLPLLRSLVPAAPGGIAPLPADA